MPLVIQEGTIPITPVATLAISPPSRVAFDRMKLGENVVTGTLNVKCNAAYQVYVFDIQSAPATSWHMTQWQVATGTFLNNPLRLRDPLHVASLQHDVTAGTPALLVSGGPAGQQGGAGQDYLIGFKQTLYYQDAALPAGQSYHLVLTWQAFVAF
jgi:hypothetical protein